MLEICPRCGNHGWDKEVENIHIKCPKCGYVWEYRALPLFILTGCSGIGKTTTARKLIQQNNDFIVLDADIFYNAMPHQTDEDYHQQIDILENLSKDIMQCGKPVLWTMAGNLDKLNSSYQSRFFSQIYCLALVCDEASLRYRMTEGRGITDENWIQSSVDYNNYFLTHHTLGDISFELLNTQGKDTDIVAKAVRKWVLEKILPAE